MSRLINKYTDDYGCCSVCGSPSCSICEKYDGVGSTFGFRFGGQWPELKTSEQRKTLFERIRKEYGLSVLLEMIKHYRFDKVSNFQPEIEDATRGEHI